MAVIGLDLSMTSTGIAKINRGLSGQGPIITTFSVKSRGKRGDTLLDRVARIDHMIKGITACVSADVNLAVLESPSYGSAGSGTWDRAWLWGGVVTWLWKHDVPVALCAPTTLKKWATGQGRPGVDPALTKAQQAKASKQAVQDAVQALFPDVKLATNDEADALALAHLGAFYREFVDIPLVENRHTVQAMAAVTWPALEEN